MEHVQKRACAAVQMTHSARVSVCGRGRHGACNIHPRPVYFFLKALEFSSSVYCVYMCAFYMKACICPSTHVDVGALCIDPSIWFLRHHLFSVQCCIAFSRIAGLKGSWGSPVSDSHPAIGVLLDSFREI